MSRSSRELPWPALGGAVLIVIAAALGVLQFQRTSPGEAAPAGTTGPLPAAEKTAAARPELTLAAETDPRKASKRREREKATSLAKTQASSPVSSPSSHSSASSSSLPHPPRPPAAFLSERTDAQRDATAFPLVHLISQQDLEAVVGPVEPTVLEGLRRAFDKDAGVGTLPPDSPEYAKRWAMAKPSAADRFRTVFGWAAYAELQRRNILQGER